MHVHVHVYLLLLLFFIVLPFIFPPPVMHSPQCYTGNYMYIHLAFSFPLTWPSCLPSCYTQKRLAGVVVTKEKLELAKSICDAHLGEGIFNYEGWKYILEHHGGKLPLRIKAVPEGSVVPFRNGETTCVLCIEQARYYM